jgi:putative tricarboxylic transport membrane protein
VFRSNPYDLAILVIFGALGYLAKKLQFDVTPLAMGFILGQPLEYAFGQTVILSGGQIFHYIFLERPITGAIIILTPVITYLMWRRSMRLRRQYGAG